MGVLGREHCLISILCCHKGHGSVNHEAFGWRVNVLTHQFTLSSREEMDLN